MASSSGWPPYWNVCPTEERGRLRSSNNKMAGNRVVSSQDTIDLKGKVFQGTCGWSDSSIVKCGKFYPSSVKTTEDRLLHYSRFFPCVECDSSNYAIPSPAAVEKWIKCVPAGFKFHFKAFGFFTRKVSLICRAVIFIQISRKWKSCCTLYFWRDWVLVGVFSPLRPCIYTGKKKKSKIVHIMKYIVSCKNISIYSILIILWRLIAVIVLSRFSVSKLFLSPVLRPTPSLSGKRSWN